MPTSDTSTAPMGNVRFESVSPRMPRERLDAWDAARLMATLGIVWTHVCDAQGIDASIGTLGRFGTSYYILAAALFTVRGYESAVRRKFSEEAGRRARRLLLPFAIWSAIYFVYYYSESLRTDESFASLIRWWGPAAGTALHLWFLPFIYVWGLLGAWAVPRLMRLRPALLNAAGPVLALVFYWFCYSKIFFWVDRPWLWSWHLHRLDRWIDEAPLYVAAILLGTAFYRLAPQVHAQIRRHKVAVALVSAALFLITQILYSNYVHFVREQTGTDGRFMANIAGLTLLCGSAAMSDSKLIRTLAPIGRFTYVTFLVHMLVLELLRAPMKSLPGYGEVPTALVCTVIVFAISLGVSWLVARFRLFAWLRP